MLLFCTVTVVQAESGIDKIATHPDRAIAPNTAVDTDFMGLGLLKKNAMNPCKTATNRATEVFWDCHVGQVSEESSAGDIQIELAEKKFVISRDLSQSSDREFDEMMIIVDALPTLVTFACYPEYRISDVPIQVTEDLKSADISYSGSLRRQIGTNEDLIRWELDAYNVYKTLSSYCSDYYCEFADVRTSGKFWLCNSASLRENIYLEPQALNVTLRDGYFRVTKSANANSGSGVGLHEFVADVAALMESIACHPESSLMDVPLSDGSWNGRPSTINIESLGDIVLGDSNQLTFTANAFTVYTSIGKSCLE